MKKFNIGFITFILCVIVAASVTMAMQITPQTPLIGGFIYDTPPELAKTHCDVLTAMKKVAGTKRWTANWMEDGTLPINPDGGCTNFSVAIRRELFKLGYHWSQIKYIHCSVYDEEKPDHVIVELATDGKRFMFDSRKDWVMTPEEYPNRLTIEDILAGKPLYLGWAQVVDGKKKTWIRADFR